MRTAIMYFFRAAFFAALLLGTNPVSAQTGNTHITQRNNTMNTKFKGSEATMNGELPKVGEAVPDVRYVGADLKEEKLSSLKGNVVVLFSVPSVDTKVCAKETHTFNEKLSALGVRGVAISEDLPFALSRYCAAEGVEHVKAVSDFRYRDMDKFGVRLLDSPLAGLLARVVFVIDKEGVLRYVQVVPELTSEPDYDAVLAEVRKVLEAHSGVAR